MPPPHIALGHPIGASGTRIFVDLLHELLRQKKHKGLATMCIGGGQGVALAVECGEEGFATYQEKAKARSKL